MSYMNFIFLGHALLLGAAETVQSVMSASELSQGELINNHNISLHFIFYAQCRVTQFDPDGKLLCVCKYLVHSNIALYRP